MERLNSFLEQIGLEGNIRVLALQTIISQIGFGMFYVIWQPFILSTGASVAHLGVIQSLINLVTAGGLILWGVLSDRFGRKPVILVSNACRAIAMVALLFTGNFFLLLAFAFLVGLSCLFMQYNPARNALISESVGGKKRATAFSTLLGISQITSTAVASAGGYIAIKAGYHPIIYLCIAGDTASIVLMALFLGETHDVKDVESKARSNLIMRLLDYIIPERKILKLYFIMIVIGIGYSTSYSVFYGMLVDNFGFTEFQLGILSTIFNLVAGASAIPMGKLSDRFGRKPMLKIGWVMGIITALGFIFSRRFELFIIFNITSALDMNFWLSAWMAMVSERAPSGRRSMVWGKLDSYMRLAGIPAPLLGGLLYTIYGYIAPLIVHLAFLFIYGGLIISLKDD